MGCATLQRVTVGKHIGRAADGTLRDRDWRKALNALVGLSLATAISDLTYLDFGGWGVALHTK
jgi:hypothetical protein